MSNNERRQEIQLAIKTLRWELPDMNQDIVKYNGQGKTKEADLTRNARDRVLAEIEELQKELDNL
jgi:hypothetical protein